MGRRIWFLQTLGGFVHMA